MNDYNEDRALAEEIILEFGYPGDFIKLGSAGSEDALGNIIAAIDDETISGTITPMLSYKAYDIDGDLIQAGDGYVFFHSDDAPGVNWTTTIDMQVYRVVSVKSFTGYGINVFRKFQLRK